MNATSLLGYRFRFVRLLMLLRQVQTIHKLLITNADLEGSMPNPTILLVISLIFCFHNSYYFCNSCNTGSSTIWLASSSCVPDNSTHALPVPFCLHYFLLPPVVSLLQHDPLSTQSAILPGTSGTQFLCYYRCILLTGSSHKEDK